MVSGAYPRLLVAEVRDVAVARDEDRHDIRDVVRDAWDRPGSGIEPMSPAVAGRFFITEPPGKPHLSPPFFFAMMIGGISV